MLHRSSRAGSIVGGADDRLFPLGYPLLDVLPFHCSLGGAMDSVQRMMMRWLMVIAIAVAAMFAPRAQALTYEGVDDPPARRVRLNPVIVGANPFSAAGGSAGQVNEWLIANRSGQRLCWHNDVAYFYTSDAYYQENPSVTVAEACVSVGDAVVFGASVGTVVNECLFGLVMYNTQAGPRCRSACFLELNIVRQFSVSIANQASAPPKACATFFTQSCAYVDTTTTSVQIGAVWYRSGGWTGTGQTCMEDGCINCPVSSPVVPEGGVEGGGGLDETAKGDLAAVKVNTGAEGALKQGLDDIKKAIAPTTSSMASYVDCAQEWTCSGEPGRCSELAAKRIEYCNMRDTQPGVSQALADVATGLLNQTPEEFRASLNQGQVNVASGINRPRFLQANSCPTPVTQTLAFGPINKTFTVKFDAFCQLASLIAFFVVAGSGVLGARIFIGGMS